MKVSGTIVLGQKGTTTFLVSKTQPYSFVSVEDADESKTALGIILSYYRSILGVNTDHLRLEELSMVNNESGVENLFVFSIHDNVDEIVKICDDHQDVDFVDVAQLKQLFAQVEMDTAPFFTEKS